jgi:hypothetical protein
MHLAAFHELLALAEFVKLGRREEIIVVPLDLALAGGGASWPRSL